MALYQPRVVIVFMRNVYVWHWFLYSMLSYWSYPWKTTVIIVLHFFTSTPGRFSLGFNWHCLKRRKWGEKERTYTKEYTHTQIKKCMSIIRKKYGRVKIIPKGRTWMRGATSTKLKIRVVEGEKRFILKGKREQSEIVLPRGNGGRAPQQYL